MKQNRLNCFISYCHDKIDRDSLVYILNRLKEGKILDKNINYIVDFKEANIKNWNQFIEEKVNNSQIVLMICTPSYKQKVMNHYNGTWKEYKIIMEKYYKSNNQNINIDEKIESFDLIPVLLQGNSDQSVPDDIIKERINFHEFTWLRPIKSKKNKYKLSDKQRTKFRETIKPVRERIRQVYIENFTPFEKSYNKIIHEMKVDELFNQTKAHFYEKNFRKDDYANKLFVRTSVYKKAASQASYIFAGRKGSGKSAMIQILAQKRNNDFFIHLPISRNHINLTTCYNLITDEFQSDTKYLSKKIDVLNFSWKLFFRLFIADRIIHLSLNNKLNTLYLNDVKQKMIPFFLNLTNETESDFKSTYYPDVEKKSDLFILALGLVLDYLKGCIKNARPDQKFFYLDIEKSFQYEKLLHATFTDKIESLIEKIIINSRKKILITFDDADSYYEDIRYDEPSMKFKKNKLEVDMLYSLLSTVCDIKQLKQGDPLAYYFDFSISVASEHFFEILNNERDAYRMNQYYSIIIWSGIELALMLRKRLELTTNYRVKKIKPDVKSTLEDICSNKFKRLSHMINFEMDSGSKHEMPLFIYILRYTFWRPREILIYFAKIIAILKEYEKWNTILDSEAIRLLIRKTTRDVIKTEFLMEYNAYINNINDIIFKFQGAKQILSFENVKSRLSNIYFKIALNKNKDLSIISKIKLLYQIGFLGVYVSSELKKLHNIQIDSAFIFDEGSSIINNLTKENCDKYLFAIHPIFQSYLNLKLDPSRLISHYTWNYLKRLEGIMSATNHLYLVQDDFFKS